MGIATGSNLFWPLRSTRRGAERRYPFCFSLFALADALLNVFRPHQHPVKLSSQLLVAREISVFNSGDPIPESVVAWHRYHTFYSWKAYYHRNARIGAAAGTCKSRTSRWEPCDYYKIAMT